MNEFTRNMRWWNSSSFIFPNCHDPHSPSICPLFVHWFLRNEIVILFSPPIIILENNVGSPLRNGFQVVDLTKSHNRNGSFLVVTHNFI